MQYSFQPQYMNNMSPYNQNGGVGYAPTPPTFRYNGYMPQPQQNYNYYSSLGQYALNQVNANPYAYNSYTGYNQPYYFDYNQQRGPVFEEAYKNGAMPLSQYLSFNNDVMSKNYVGNDGRYATFGQDDWYANAVNISRRQQEMQRQYMEQMQVQMDNWNMMCSLNDRFNGVEADETGQTIFEQKVLYDQAMQAYLYQVQQIDQAQDNFTNFTKTLHKSTDKKYVTPLKMELITNWNNYYHARNDRYPKEYGVDEFFNQGILTNQIFDDMILDAKVRERELFYQYSKQDFRQSIHQMYPHYDPISGTSSVRLSIDDMEVSLPPQISQSEYYRRKEQFMRSIMGNKNFNPGGV